MSIHSSSTVGARLGFKMKLLVMLMLAAPTLPLDSSKKVTKLVRPLNPSLGNKIPEIRSNRPGIQGFPGAGGSEIHVPVGPRGRLGPQGAAGPRVADGPQGKLGPQGAAGPWGRLGPQGAAGPRVADGPRGPAGPWGRLGPQGAAGPRVGDGPRGPAGPRGKLGPQGAAGPRGELGPQGAAGPRVADGPQGELGPQGAAGAGSGPGLLNLNKQNRSHFVNIDQTNLKWQTWDGSLPNGAVSIYNKYVGRTDYICKHDCDAGFYWPDDHDQGHFCHYSDKEVGHKTSQFEILLNIENIEVLEWKEASHGSVPQHSVLTCPHKKNVHVGMNKYGLGKVVPQEKVFFLPWDEKEYWYNDYQVLTFSKDIVSEHVYDVKYKMDQSKIIKFPPKTIDKSSISNNQCQSVSKAVTLTKTTQESQKWVHSISVHVGARISITASIPMLVSTGIELSMQVSYQFTKETTHTESNTHSVSITYDVPSNHFCTVRMVGKKSEVRVPYTARLSRTYGNGETREASITGTYKGVQVGEVQTIVDRCVPKAHNRPCPEKQDGCQ